MLDGGAVSYETLMSPIRIGTLKLKNRCVVAPMHSNTAGEDHQITQGAIDYYSARARGGYAVVTPEFLAVDDSGYAVATEMGICDDSFFEGLSSLAKAVHDEGGLIAAQLHHAGIHTETACIGQAPWAVSSVVSAKYCQPVREMSTDDIEYLIGKYIEAADRAKRAGFDMVQVHAANGYLVQQFLSAATNKRCDEYGGGFENRARFCTSIIRGIKERCGADYPVEVRMCSEERIVDGIKPNEAAVFARLFEEAGADAISVTMGEPAGGMVVPTYYNRPGFNIDSIRIIKDAVTVPLTAAGRINDPDLAETFLRSGKADIIAFGRQSICDSELPLKVKEGRVSEIFHCTGCMQRCYYSKGLDEQDTIISCMINPFSGKEKRWAIKESQTKKIGRAHV